VEAEQRRPATAEIGEAAAKLPSEYAFAKRRAKVAKLLRMDGQVASLVAYDASGARTAEVFARLLDMTDTQVMQVLAMVMAETLAAGTDLIDTLGQRLKVDCLQHWQPDEPFFVLVKDREAVSGMLAEVIGETAANSYLTEPGIKKAIIRKALAGDGRSKVEGWSPLRGLPATWPSRNGVTRAAISRLPLDCRSDSRLAVHQAARVNALITASGLRAITVR
jgi:ParB family chromosome partitioning protein